MPSSSRGAEAGACFIAALCAGRGRSVLASHSFHMFGPLPGRSAAGEAGNEKAASLVAGGSASWHSRGV
jgi:hypothetical protein